MKTTPAPQTLLALLLVGVLAGCGGETESPGSGEDARSEAVSMDDLAYTPDTVEVPVGSAVTWTNDDEAPHTVTFSDDTVESSEQLATGDTFTATFAEAGTFDYVCALHPTMTGSVTVR